MFNYFTNQRHKDTQQAKEINTNTQEKLKKFKKCTSYPILEKDKILMRKYVDRTTHSYERMLDANNDIKEYKNNRHQFRDENKSLNFGPPSFYFHARSDEERVNVHFCEFRKPQENKTLDRIPFFGKQNPIFHEFRSNKSQGNVKFTSFDSKSRVLQSIKNMSTNQIPNSWHIDIKTYLSINKSKPKCNSSETNISTSILPVLNVKYHPKTLSSIHNGVQVGGLKNVVIGKKKREIDQIKKGKDNGQGSETEVKSE